MWIDKSDDQDPYNRQGNNINSPTNQPSVGAGGGSGPMAGVTSAPSGSNPSTVNPIQPNKTQDFASVQDYLKGNQQQGENLAGKVTGKLDTDLSNEKGAIDQSAGNVKNQIQSSTPTYDSNLTNEALNDPTKVTSDPGKLNSFLKQWNASYSGPSSFESTADYSNAAGAKNEADARKAQVGSAGGQQQLLHDDFGVYGQGNQGLDQAILQNSSKYGDVQGYGSKFGGIGDYLTSKSADVNSQAANAQTAADQTRNSTRDLFSNNLTGLQTGLNERVAQDKAQGQSATDRLKSDLASGKVSAIKEDLTSAGVPKDQVQSISSYLLSLSNGYGINPDLSQYSTYTPNTAITPETVATPEEFAKAQAWQQLTGVNYGGLLNPANASLANTWNQNQNAIDAPRLSDYLKTTLNQNDTSFLSKPIPDLVKALPDLSSRDSGTMLAQKYIDAAVRQGYKPGDPLPKALVDLKEAARTKTPQVGSGGLSPAAQAIYDAITALTQPQKPSAPTSPGVIRAF